MSLNWKEIDLILSECTLTKGKIQQVRQPDFNTVYFGIYASQRLHHLHFHFTQNATCFHLTENAAKKPRKALRFQQLLQARLVGATIESIEHLNKDRMILFACKKKTIKDEKEHLYLFVRLWNNQANIILYNDSNTIIDALYHRPQQNIMPKAPMLKISSHTNAKNYNHSNTTIRAWHRESESLHPFNDYIAQYYRNVHHKAYLEKKELQFISLLQKTIPYLEKSILETKKQIEQQSQFELSLFIGNEILANIHRIETHQEWFSISHPHTMESFKVHLDTNKNAIQNAETYFQKYKKAHTILEHLNKKLKTLEDNYTHMCKAKQLLSHMEQEWTTLQNSEQNHTNNNTKNIDTILLEVENIIKHNTFAHKRISNQCINNLEITHKKENTAHSKKQVHKNTYDIGIQVLTEKYRYFIGRNAKENDALLRYVVRGNDTWMHVRNTPGSFVFIRAQNKQSVPVDTLKMAAQLACLFSKCKHGSSIDLHYTQVKHLRKIPKKIGLVSVQRDNNFSVIFNRNSTRSFLNETIS